jgi:hypothetical protein
MFHGLMNNPVLTYDRHKLSDFRINSTLTTTNYVKFARYNLKVSHRHTAYNFFGHT